MTAPTFSERGIGVITALAHHRDDDALDLIEECPDRAEMVGLCAFLGTIASAWIDLGARQAGVTRDEFLAKVGLYAAEIA